MKPLTVFLFVFALSACGSYPCMEHPGLQLNFVSFTDAEIQPFHLIRYVKGSQFRNQSDSITVDSTVARFNRRNDTLFLVITGQETFVTSKYDYRIVVPSTQQEFRITDIEEEMQIARKSIFPRTQDMCINPIRSFKINGSKYVANSWDLFLKK
jgi:hypothetical protein